MYATYTDYTTYLSGRKAKLTQTEYPYYGQKATIYMDSIAPNLAAATVTDKIKSCCCEIAEMLKVEESRNGIQSENNDGYSVSYRTDLPIAVNINSTMQFYLSGTGLLYRGVSVIC